MLLTRAPLSIARAFDLHVLGLPPAFALSQDQTLRFLFDVSDLIVSPQPWAGCLRCKSEHFFFAQATSFKREFDPGSERTLAACLTHASRVRVRSNTGGARRTGA